jgi:DNA-binding transcriptional ArsR family regulator
VRELADALPVTRPAVSQHLRVLKDVRLVTDRPEGTRRVYRLSPDGLEDVRAFLERFWARALAGLKEAAEE